MDASPLAELLDTSTASVNSALQRAHARLSAVSPSPDKLAEIDGIAERDLLDRYVAAFQAMDVDALKQTLREDALLQMPPFPAWFSGRDTIGQFLSTVFARGGSHRFIATRANGQPALAAYLRRDEETYRFRNVEVFTLDQLGIARRQVRCHSRDAVAVDDDPAAIPELHLSADEVDLGLAAELQDQGGRLDGAVCLRREILEDDAVEPVLIA